MSFQDFKFQLDAVDKIENLFHRGLKSILLQSATGSGKTYIAGKFFQRYLQTPFHKVLCLVPFQTLVGQFHDTLHALDIPVSVLHDQITKNKDGIRYELDYTRQVLLTMPETFLNTKNGLNGLPFDPSFVPTLIVLDEAHKATSLIYQLIRAMYPFAKILGLSATPYRDACKDGEELSEWYQELVTTVSVRELIELGRLVQPLYFSRSKDSHLVDDWVEFTQTDTNKGSIVFTRDTRHSFAIKQAFEARGIRAEVITAGSDTDPDFYVTPQTPNQRQAIYNDFDDGEIDVLISVAALCEGFDSPRAKYCFIQRGVGNPALFQQIIGRVIRFMDGKLNGYVIDYGDNIREHGHIEDYEWSLDNPMPESMKVKPDQRQVSLDSYNRVGSMWFCCTCCGHVYDLKKNMKCSHCKKTHEIEVVAKVSELLSANNVPVYGPKEFNEFVSRAKAAQNSALAKQLLNKRYGNIYNEFGALNDDFAFIPAILNSKYSDKVNVL